MARAEDPHLARIAATKVVRVLRERGFTAYFAGGCVRDELLGLHPTDYDVATNAQPKDIRQHFERTHAVGEHFGVILVRLDDCTIEVATFRSDGAYTDSRRPDAVKFSTPEEDAQRRDFTINALFLNPLAPAQPLGPGLPVIAGEVIDLVGGLDDLRRRVVRAVGNADQRLAEDHLRALRAVRFTARLGFTLEEGTAEAVKRQAAELRGVSRERVGEEMRRMLSHPSRAEAVRLLWELGLDEPVLGERQATTALAILRGLRPPVWTRESIITGVPTNASDAGGLPPMLALAAWVLDMAQESGGGRRRMSHGDVEAVAAQRRRSMCLSNDETADLKASLNCHGQLMAWIEGKPSVAERKRLAIAPGFCWALALVAAVDEGLMAKIEANLADLRMIGEGLGPVAWIDGEALIRLGFKPGPGFQKILDLVYDAQLEGRVRNRAEGMELARTLRV